MASTSVLHSMAILLVEKSIVLFAGDNLELGWPTHQCGILWLFYKLRKALSFLQVTTLNLDGQHINVAFYGCFIS